MSQNSPTPQDRMNRTAIVPTDDWDFATWCRAVDLWDSHKQPGEQARRHYLAALEHLPLFVEDKGAKELVGKDKFLGWLLNAAQIIQRSDAVQAVAVLNYYAQQNRCTVMNGINLIDHARIFLRSTVVCKQPFADLSPDEVELISNHSITQYIPSSHSAPTGDLYSLYKRVFPSPLPYLYGRSEDIQALQTKLREPNPIVTIAGNAGDGKTHLAWHFALHAVQALGIYDAFDWTTDRRAFLDVDGKIKSTNLPPLSFDAILNSMVARFQWDDIMLERQRNVMQRCAERLRQGFFLLVIDNIETLEQAESLVENLNRLFGAKPLRNSRAIVTSRVNLPLSGVGHVELRGMSEDACVAFIDTLERSRHSFMLLDRQRRELARATGGNPLFIQIAMARYGSVGSDFDDLIDRLRSGKTLYAQFQNLFDALYTNLEPLAQYLAKHAAQYNDEITTPNLVEDVQSQHQIETEVIEVALEQLIQRRVLNRGILPGVFTLHPLVRAYLRREIEEDGKRDQLDQGIS